MCTEYMPTSFAQRDSMWKRLQELISRAPLHSTRISRSKLSNRSLAEVVKRTLPLLSMQNPLVRQELQRVSVPSSYPSPETMMANPCTQPSHVSFARLPDLVCSVKLQGNPAQACGAHQGAISGANATSSHFGTGKWYTRTGFDRLHGLLYSFRRTQASRTMIETCTSSG